MEATQYLNNKIVLENCREYLKLLEFLPQYEDIIKKIDEYQLENEEMHLMQLFSTNKVNEIIINFDFIDFSKGDLVISNLDLLLDESNEFLMTIKIFNGEVKSININYYNNPLSKKSIKVKFLNNEVCKVEESYKENGNKKEMESYYIKGEMIASSIYNNRWREFEKRVCVEKALTPSCGYWYHDTYYERDYYNETCYIQKYRQNKEDLSHNQFDKKYNGVLKRVKKLATENK